VEAAGVELCEGARGEKLMGWWCVEMERFLGFARSLPEGSPLGSALEGYGRYLKAHEPKLEEWRISQAREALRVFRKGIENWRVVRAESGEIQVRFRAKARVGASECRIEGAEGGVFLGRGGGCTGLNPDLAAVGEDSVARGTCLDGMDCLDRSQRLMRIRRMARRTEGTYLGWQRRYLKWCSEKALDPWRREGFEGFISSLALERVVSASTQNQAFSAILFLTKEVMERPVDGIDAVRAHRGRKLPVVLSREELRRLFFVS
jgi:hypothetical protein